MDVTTNITSDDSVQKKLPVNSKVEVSIDNNYTVSFLTISEPQNGGSEITYDECIAALEEKKIKYGIREDDIKKAISDKLYDMNICAARWTAPIDGENGSIKYLFSCDSTLAPKETADGRVDFRNLGIINNVNSGTIIAEITLPTEGTAGMDLRNVPVKQIAGAPAVFVIGENTAVDESGTKLVALKDGNLRWVQNKFVVEETVVIAEDVDTSIGNIDFLGDIVIKGGVHEGYVVTSKRNITINGNANGATINAGGNVTIKSGSINSNIKAGGDIKLGFCENSQIACGGNLDSQSFVGCDVFCKGKLTASGKGIIAGGKYTCMTNIEAGTIGSLSYIKTLITLGNNAVLAEERTETENKIKECEENVAKLNQIAEFLKEQQKLKGRLSPEREQMKVNSLKTSLTTQMEIKKLKKRINEIDFEIQNAQDLSLSCRKELFPGTSIRINSFTMQVNNIYNHCRVAIDAEGIAIKPF